MIDTKKIEIKDGKNVLKFEIRKMNAVEGEKVVPESYRTCRQGS